MRRMPYPDRFDFDTPIDRRGTASMKWEKYGDRDVIPMWVADMDFATAPCVVEELRRRVDHRIFGYTQPPAELAPTVVASLQREYGWRVDPNWILWLPGLVVGLNVVCRAFADEDDEALTAVPIYPPFLSAPENGGRRAVRVPLQEEKGRWTWDMEALERAVSPRTRLLLVCSPHNPTGRVWTRNELNALSEFCVRHDLVLVSDEIHCGLVLDKDRPHVPAATLAPDIGERTVTLMSASKTFNMPGLGCAFAIASSARLREKMKRVMAGIVHHVGALGYFATLAAFRDGAQWRTALVDYLRGNRDLVMREIRKMRGLRTWHAEATYLAWIDARALPVENAAKFFEDTGVGLYDGLLFGGPGFLRLNFACPRSLLEQALERMRRAVENLSK